MLEAALLAAGVAAAAAALWFGLDRYGGREARAWAVPASCAVLTGGLGHLFQLPNWLVVAAFLGIPFLVHRKARQRQASAAAPLSEILCDGAALRRVPAADPRVLGAWTELAEDGRDAALLLRLVFMGETEDEYRVHFTAEFPKGRPGLLFCRLAESGVAVPAPLAESAPITGLPGQPDTVEIRALPGEYAFSVLDVAAFARLSEILELRRRYRELSITVSGRVLWVESDGLLETHELGRLGASLAGLARQLRELAKEQS